MNPIFIFLVVVAAVLLWFILSFVFAPLGRLVYRLWKDAMDEINKEYKTKEEKEKQE